MILKLSYCHLSFSPLTYSSQGRRKKLLILNLNKTQKKKKEEEEKKLNQIDKILALLSSN
jgi:hypothetical protein